MEPLTPLQRKFCHGLCQLYAHAACQHLDKPIINFYWRYRTRKNYVHSAVQLKRNLFLDARGLHTFGQIQKYYGNAHLKPFRLVMQRVGPRSTKYGLSCWARKKNFIRDIAEAHRLLMRQLPKLGDLRCLQRST